MMVFCSYLLTIVIILFSSTDGFLYDCYGDNNYSQRVIQNEMLTSKVSRHDLKFEEIKKGGLENDKGGTSRDLKER